MVNKISGPIDPTDPIEPDPTTGDTKRSSRSPEIESPAEEREKDFTDPSTSGGATADDQDSATGEYST